MRVYVALSVLLVVAACSGEGQHAISSGDYTIYVHDSALLPRGGMAADIVGKLAVVDGCIVIGSEATDWYPVVWPSGTGIASVDPLVIRLPSGAEVREGETVIGGGGFLDARSLEVRIPARCLPETREVAVFNPDDDPAQE